jgi:hypothetical protein
MEYTLALQPEVPPDQSTTSLALFVCSRGIGSAPPCREYATYDAPLHVTKSLHAHCVRSLVKEDVETCRECKAVCLSHNAAMAALGERQVGDHLEPRGASAESEE